MRNTFCLLAIIALVPALNGCGNDEDTRPPDTPSVINIETPIAGTIFLNGTNLQVKGDVADDNALEFVRLEIKNSSSGQVYYQQNNATGNVLFHNFLWNWTVTGISSSTNVTVKVTAVDRYDYQVSKEVNVVLTD